MGIEVQQIATCLDVRLQRRVAVVIGIAKAYLHDKQVFIVVSQDGIRVGGIVEIFFTEGLTDPRHKHIVQVYQVHPETAEGILRFPLVMPSCREHPSEKLWTVLRIVKQ